MAEYFLLMATFHGVIPVSVGGQQSVCWHFSKVQLNVYGACLLAFETAAGLRRCPFSLLCFSFGRCIMSGIE